MASGPAKMTGGEVSALNDVTSASNSFAFELYRALSKVNPSTNVFTSPLSLQIALALAYSGAGGKTAEEIATVLKIPKENGKMFQGYHALINILQDPVLSLATKMFVENSFHVKEEFNKNAEKHFESDVQKVNFLSDTSGAQNTINEWVEKKTNNKIKKLIPDGLLNSLTKMVLVNAIHFKANWKEPFPARNTHPDKFYVNEKDTIEIPMMFVRDKFGYAENSELDAKILELPYEGEKFSMYIVLPNKITGLTELENKISKIGLGNVLKGLSSNEVEVTLPKFEISQTIDLNEILKNFGCVTMFDEDNANFSGISDIKIAVSKVIQKAFIQVDEKGTEAAAATGMVAQLLCMIYPEEFKADHPFLLIIAEHLTPELIIFVGNFVSL